MTAYVPTRTSRYVSFRAAVRGIADIERMMIRAIPTRAIAMLASGGARAPRTRDVVDLTLPWYAYRGGACAAFDGASATQRAREAKKRGPGTKQPPTQTLLSASLIE